MGVFRHQYVLKLKNVWIQFKRGGGQHFLISLNYPMGGGVKPNSDVVLKFSGFLIMKPPLSVCEFVYLSVTFAFADAFKNILKTKKICKWWNHENNSLKKLFPLNHLLNNNRHQEMYEVTFANTNRLNKSNVIIVQK